MRLEKWFISNLDDSQRKIIIQSITDDIIVQGAAGSGKRISPSIVLYRQKIKEVMLLSFLPWP